MVNLQLNMEEIKLDSQNKLGKVNSRREARAVIDRWNAMTALEETDNALKADPFGLTNRDLYEFKTAYTMISDMNNGVMDRYFYTICFHLFSNLIYCYSRDRVDQVFQAVGLTMQQADLDHILEEATVEEVFTMDSILEEFRQWKIEQIDKDNLKALFRMLAVDKYVHSTFPEKHKYAQGENTATSSKTSRKMTTSGNHLITESTVLNIVEELAVSANNNEDVGSEDPLGFMAEIKHKFEKVGELGINYEEFERLFVSTDNF